MRHKHAVKAITGKVSNETLENIEGGIKIDNLEKLATQPKINKAKTQRNICWTRLYKKQTQIT